METAWSVCFRAPQPGSYPSVFEENAEDSLLLTFRDDI